MIRPPSLLERLEYSAALADLAGDLGLAALLREAGASISAHYDLDARLCSPRPLSSSRRARAARRTRAALRSALPRLPKGPTP